MTWRRMISYSSILQGRQVLQGFPVRWGFEDIIVVAWEIVVATLRST
jgi:hypothetical protein